MTNFVKRISNIEEFKKALLENNIHELNSLKGSEILSIKKAIEPNTFKSPSDEETLLYSGGSFILETTSSTLEIASSFHFNSLIYNKLTSNELFISDALNKLDPTLIESHYTKKFCHKPISRVELITFKKDFYLHKGKPNNVGLQFIFENSEHLILGHLINKNISSVGFFSIDDIREEILGQLIFSDLQEQAISGM